MVSLNRVNRIDGVLIKRTDAIAFNKTTLKIEAYFRDLGTTIPVFPLKEWLLRISLVGVAELSRMDFGLKISRVMVDE